VSLKARATVILAKAIEILRKSPSQSKVFFKATGPARNPFLFSCCRDIHFRFARNGITRSKESFRGLNIYKRSGSRHLALHQTSAPKSTEQPKQNSLLPSFTSKCASLPCLPRLSLLSPHCSPQQFQILKRSRTSIAEQLSRPPWMTIQSISHSLLRSKNANWFARASLQFALAVYPDFESSDRVSLRVAVLQGSPCGLQGLLQARI
jgi:hypothetical protein